MVVSVSVLILVTVEMDSASMRGGEGGCRLLVDGSCRTRPLFHPVESFGSKSRRRAAVAGTRLTPEE